MSKHYEHYYTHGEPVPVSKHMYKVLKAFLVIFIILISAKENFVLFERTLAAEIKVSDNLILKKVYNPGVNSLGIPAMLAKFRKRLIFFDKNLSIKHRRSFTNKEIFSANPNGYVVYKRLGKSISAFNSDGTLQFKYKTKTYPRTVKSGKFYFLFTGDQSGIGFLRNTGHISGKFKYFTSLISGCTYSKSDDSAYLTLLNGDIHKFNISGSKTLWRKRIGNSRYKFIKAVTISDDEKVIGTLSGIDPELFSLIDRSGSLQWSIKTGSGLKSKAYIHVGNTYCLGHSKKRVYILERSSGSLFYEAMNISTGQSGIIYTDFSNDKTSGRVLFSYSDGEKSTVKLLNSDGELLYHRVFSSPYAHTSLFNNGTVFIIQTSDRILIYCNANIL